MATFSGGETLLQATGLTVSISSAVLGSDSATVTTVTSGRYGRVEWHVTSTAGGGGIARLFIDSQGVIIDLVNTTSGGEFQGIAYLPSSAILKMSTVDSASISIVGNAFEYAIP